MVSFWPLSLKTVQDRREREVFLLLELVYGFDKAFLQWCDVMRTGPRQTEPFMFSGAGAAGRGTGDHGGTARGLPLAGQHWGVEDRGGTARGLPLAASA